MTAAVVRPRSAGLIGRGRGRREVYYGCVPAVLVAVLTVTVLQRAGVHLGELALFGCYLAGGIALPGTLLWRAAGQGRHGWAADVAAGTCVGYAVEVLTYIPARLVGLPLLVLGWPVATIGLFAAVPSLRRHWRGGPAATPLWWSWMLAGLVGYLVLWSAHGYYRIIPLGRPANGISLDVSYELALAGELKHHMPPVDPNVLGLPLSYHWFALAEAAASSWATGLELQTLMLRLSPLPMLAALLVLVPAMGVRLTGRRRVGALAVLIMCFAHPPSPYAWNAHLLPSGSIWDAANWSNPTQPFGAALFAALMLPLLDVVRCDRKPRWPLLPILAVLVVALPGAKGVYPPLLAAGLVVVIVGRALRSRPLGTVAALLALVLLVELTAAVLLFRGDPNGMFLKPMSLAGKTLRSAGLPTDRSLYAAVAVALVVGWAATWAGLFGLLWRPAVFRDPAIVLLCGIAAAGLAVTVLFGHPGASETYFLEAARPYLALLAAAGFMVLWRHRTGPVVAVLGGAVSAGMALTRLVSALGLRTLPSSAGAVVAPLLLLLALTLMAILAVVGSSALMAALAMSRAALRMAPAAVLALVTGLGATTGLARSGLVFESYPLRLPRGMPVPPGAVAAGRWLRDHSRPGDVVAAEVPCVAGHCFNDRFWASAYSERRILLEGWAYSIHATNQSGDREPWWLPFEDPRRLVENNAAFRSPSVASVSVLRKRYGVRWLIADLLLDPGTVRLGRVTSLRFINHDCAVYEIPSATGDARQ